MRRTAIALLTALIVGCATQGPGTEVIAPDGHPAVALRCKTPPHCYQAAGRRCPTGYHRLDEDKAVVASGFSGNVGTRTYWLIRCK